MAIKPSTVSKEHLPVIKKASGKHVWDIDGKKYLDFTGSNLTVIIGHKKFRFKNTPNFPGKSYLEDEVSRKLSEFTLTDHFRYFKNGSDAVSCAIRLSRNILRKPNSKIIYLGYAGSHNEYAFTLNKNGIPKQQSFQTGKECDILVYESRFESKAKKIKAKIRIVDFLKEGINGLYSEEIIDASISQMIMEIRPLNTPFYDAFLGKRKTEKQKVKEEFEYNKRKIGCALAQKNHFYIFGKSISNGYPVSVLTGRDALMEKIDDIYFSSTFGGENTGLEAILKTLQKYDRKKWLKLKEYADSVLPPWQSLKPEQIKKFTKNGVLFNGYWQIMLAHTKEDIDRLASLCKKIL